MKPIKVFNDGVVELGESHYCIGDDAISKISNFIAEQSDIFKKDIAKQIAEAEIKAEEEATINAQAREREVRMMNEDIYYYNERRFTWERDNLLRLRETLENYEHEIRPIECLKVSIYVGMMAIEYEDAFADYFIFTKESNTFRHHADVSKAFPVNSSSR